MERGTVLANPAVNLSLLLVAAFFIQIYANSLGAMENIFLLQMPLEENPWTILASNFAHVDAAHLFSNLIALLIVGLPVAMKASEIRFYLFFVVVGSMAGASQIMAFYWMGQLGVIDAGTVGVMGASGGIFGIIGYLITSNRVSALSSKFMPLPSKIRYAAYLIVAIWITAATASPQAALVGHFTGLVLGLVAGRRNLLRRKKQISTLSS